MGLEIKDIKAEIASSKKLLRKRGIDYTAVFKEMSASIEEEINEIKSLRDEGSSVIPEIDFNSLGKEGFNDEQKSTIKKRGCVIIRNTFDRTLVQEWNSELGSYLKNVGYYENPDKGLDKYFSSLQKGEYQHPQIFSVYWSPPQVQARQHENLAKVKNYLNGLWKNQFNGKTVFDPNRECTYADRTRRRQPGDNSLGIKPHVDGGSVERWLEQSGFQSVYRNLLDGKWKEHDPFDAAYRTETTQISSPAVCSMFRTFQGWIALSPQGPGDGTLQLIPNIRVLGWMILRALQDDVPDDELCGAQPGRALSCDPKWHELVLEGLCTIPKMQPGDSVWWHGDVIHAVEDEHNGKESSNVIYIGAAPYCEKNAKFLKAQGESFISGKSSPDFAAEDYEYNFEGRARLNDLSELGKKQMGFEAW
tara:strand:- start:1003 stop:2259 length:1257 start_codon:yes stop_codon:yes gene_type:complete